MHTYMHGARLQALHASSSSSSSSSSSMSLSPPNDYLSMSAEKRAWEAATEAAAEIRGEAEHKPGHEGLAHSETEEHSKDTTEDDDKYTARDAARDAKQYVAGKKEQARQHLSDDAKEQLGKTPISATQKLELVRERGEERERIRLDDADKQRDNAERGSEASRNIYGAMPVGLRSVTEAIKQKLTMPGEVVVGHRRREHEGAAESQEVEAAQVAGAGLQDVRPSP